MRSGPSLPLNDQLVVYGIRKGNFAKDLMDKVEMSNSRKGNKGVGIRDDQLDAPGRISLASSCFRSSGLMRAAGTS